jgi:hypothetical protein
MWKPKSEVVLVYMHAYYVAVLVRIPRSLYVLCGCATVHMHGSLNCEVVPVRMRGSLYCEVVLVYLQGNVSCEVVPVRERGSLQYIYYEVLVCTRSLNCEVVLVRMRGRRRRYSCGPTPPPADLWARVFRDIMSWAAV